MEPANGMKPCPFCGGTETKVKPVWKDYRFVACQSCKAAGPVMKTEQEAVDAWNDRTETKWAEADPNIEELREIASKLRYYCRLRYPAHIPNPMQYLGETVGAQPGDNILRKLAEVLDPRPTCETCEHYMGGGDWGLCCTESYDLCYEDTIVCERYEPKV